MIQTRGVARLFYEFIWLPSFEHTARGVLMEEDRYDLEGQLLSDPEQGSIIEGTGGFRKIRFALKGRGKSGGARVIYFFSERRGRIYMALAYSKSKKLSLSVAEKKMLRQFAQILRGDV